jgi:predicted kinase
MLKSPPAGRYVHLAERYTRPSRPGLLITHGLSGSGKTFATQQLVDATDAIRLRSDVERKRLCGLAPLERSTGRSDLDLYAPDVTKRTYEHLVQQAARVIEAGWTAVVDATFLKRAQRDAFRRLATRLGVPFTILACRAHAETLRRRVALRSAQGTDASEADISVLSGQFATLEPRRKDTLSVWLRPQGDNMSAVVLLCSLPSVGRMSTRPDAAPRRDIRQRWHIFCFSQQQGCSQRVRRTEWPRLS